MRTTRRSRTRERQFVYFDLGVVAIEVGRLLVYRLDGVDTRSVERFDRVADGVCEGGSTGRRRSPGGDHG